MHSLVVHILYLKKKVSLGMSLKIGCSTVLPKVQGLVHAKVHLNFLILTERVSSLQYFQKCNDLFMQMYI